MSRNQIVALLVVVALTLAVFLGGYALGAQSRQKYIFNGNSSLFCSTSNC